MASKSLLAPWVWKSQKELINKFLYLLSANSQASTLILDWDAQNPRNRILELDETIKKKSNLTLYLQMRNMWPGPLKFLHLKQKSHKYLSKHSEYNTKFGIRKPGLQSW